MKSRFAIKAIPASMEPEPEFKGIIFAVTGNVSGENAWANSQKIVIFGGAEWLLNQDSSVSEILAKEREPYQHHLGIDSSQVRTSLFSKPCDRTPDSRGSMQ